MSQNHTTALIFALLLLLAVAIVGQLRVINTMAARPPISFAAIPKTNTTAP